MNTPKYSLDSNAIDSAESDYLYDSKSQITNAGKGLFTAIPIYKDEIIAIFKGEILSETESKIRVKEGNDAYFMNLINGSILDCMNTECFAKYANDAIGFSKSEMRNNAKIALDENENVCLIAIKKIQLGEEIFCDYCKKYWKKRIF
jgi:hypothetical protein